LNITLVAAVDERGGIGRNNRMPWHLSDDLKHFKKLTVGKYVLMGRKTYESAKGKLPDRHLIVLSRDPKFAPADAQVVSSFEAGQELAEAAGADDLFVIGGAQVFASALPLATRFYLTQVHADSHADIFFPPFNLADWEELERREFSAGPKNDHDFVILNLQKSII
jgi:dihydrofolate reductase